MAEVAPAGGGGPNRMFLVIALGLVGLLVIGVIAVGGIFLFSQTSRPPATPTVVAKVITPARVLPTATATATDTPAPTGTATFVIQPVAPGAGGSTPAVTTTTSVTTTATPGTGTPGAGLPQTGVGEDLLLLAAGVVLVLVIFAARRARASGAA